MRLTTKGHFAVTAVLDLSIHAAQGPVALSDLSARRGISLSYLEQLFGTMRRSGLVQSTRGPRGGYRLARAPAEISVADVILAVDEPIDATLCSGEENCREGHSKCLTHDLWVGLNEHIFDYLSRITLDQLALADPDHQTKAHVVSLHAPLIGSVRASAPHVTRVSK